MSPLNFSSTPGLGSPAPTSALSRFAVPTSSSTGLTGSGLSRFKPGSIQQPPSTHFNINEDGLTRYQQARIGEKDRAYEEAVAGGALTLDQARELFFSGEQIDDPNIFSHLRVPMEMFNVKGNRSRSIHNKRASFEIGNDQWATPVRFDKNRRRFAYQVIAPTEFMPENILAAGLAGRGGTGRKTKRRANQMVASWEEGFQNVGRDVERGFALGGPVGPGIDESALGDSQLSPEQEQLLQGAIAALDPASQMSEDDRMLILREFEEEFGPGSVKILLEEIQGQRGSGGASDGLSDSIPAVVDGVQPAALSEGEFIVPSDVVSDVGNGSTDAGARELMGMVDRIRGARGNAGKPKKINAGNLLVA